MNPDSTLLAIATQKAKDRPLRRDELRILDEDNRERSGMRPGLIPRNPIQTRRFRHLYRGMRQPQIMQVNERLLRAMAKHPFVQMIVRHRVTQAMAFCKIPQGRGDIGFNIVPADENDTLQPEDERRRQQIIDLLLNGGFHWPRPVDGKIGYWAGDGFTPALPMPQWFALLVANILTVGNAGLIIEQGKDARLCPVAHLRPVDGHSIRLTDFSEYVPEFRDDVKYVEYVILNEDRQPEYELAHNEFAMWIRDPIIENGRPLGYGRSPLEHCIDLLAGLAMAYNYNKGQFSENKLPQGVLEIPPVDEDKLDDFLTTLETNIGGPMGQWSEIPVIERQDNGQPSVQWVPLGERPADMVWERFITMTFASMCAIFGANPEEVNFPNFSARQNALQEADPETRILHGEDTGFKPLMDEAAAFVNSVIKPFDAGKWKFEWQNLGRGNAEQAETRRASRLQAGITSLDEERVWDDLPPRRYPLDLELWGKTQAAILKRKPSLLSDPDQLYAFTEEAYARLEGAFSLATQVPLSPAMQQMWSNELMEAGGGQDDMMGMMGGPTGAAPPEMGAPDMQQDPQQAAPAPPDGMMQLPLPGLPEEAAEKSLKAAADRDREIEVRFVRD